MTHDLKIWPEFFRDVACNKKQFEVRWVKPNIKQYWDKP